MVKKRGSDSSVGYGRPPKHTQFKPGQSGNPHGRPRRRTTFDDDIEAELRSSITVVEQGKRRKITKRRAIAKQHVNRAMTGDVRSTELLLKIRKHQDSDQPDHLDSLIEEFQEKNRRLLETSATDNDSPPPETE